MADSPETGRPSTGSFSLRSVAGVTALSFAQLVLLFGLQLVLAHAFGASQELDAYLAAYAIPLTIGGILSGAATNVLVPLYHRRKSESGSVAAEGEVACLLLSLAVVSTILAAGIAIGAEEICRLLYAELVEVGIGSAGVGAGELQSGASVVRLLAILVWLIPLSVLTGAYYGIEHARENFLYPAAWGVVGPVATILGFLYLSDRSIEALAWATLAGGAIGLAGLALKTPAPRGMTLTSSWAALVPFLAMGTPLLLGHAVSRLDLVVDRPLASALPEGSISHLGYAWRIILAAATIATTGLSVVIFPALARHAAAREMDKMGRDLAEGWRLLCVVLIPIVLGIGVCGEPILAACFERGEFTPHDTERVATLLNLYLGALVAAVCGELGAKTFLAFGRTWLPTLIGVTGFAVGVGLKFALVDRFGANGIAAATSTYMLLNVIALLIAVASLRLPGSAKGLAATVVRSGLAAALSVGAAYVVMQQGSAASVAAGLIVAVGAYVAILYGSGDEFVRRGITAAAALTRRSSRKPRRAGDDAEGS
ncbi:MAG TPA: lipid II flippase MurJ [Pirellulaceae bacterium]|jgi:putative peptidoglycan lipid II flippase|nr:lipid II flippase MurJ [Pirellulaceae bacterium]